MWVCFATDSWNRFKSDSFCVFIFCLRIQIFTYYLFYKNKERILGLILEKVNLLRSRFGKVDLVSAYFFIVHSYNILFFFHFPRGIWFRTENSESNWINQFRISFINPLANRTNLTIISKYNLSYHVNTCTLASTLRK